MALIVLAAMLAEAMRSAWSERRISNWLTYLGMLAGLGLALVQGFTCFYSAAIGLAIAFAAFFPLFLVRACGGGDAKLMAACGSLLGKDLALTATIYSVLTLVAFSVCIFVWRRGFDPATPESSHRDSRMQGAPIVFAIAAACFIAVL